MQNEHIHINTELLTRFILGEVSQVEQLHVIEWLEAAPANQAELDNLEAAWIKSGELDPAPLPVDVPQAWSKLEQRLDAHDNKRKGIQRFLTPAIYAAASIVLIVLLLNIFKTDTRDAISTEPVIVANTVGGAQTDTLPDGSIVILNYGSKLTYLSSADDMHRNMVLEGEAFFDVVRDTLRPFVIKAGMGGVRVLGTSFNVKITNSTDVTVDVKSGLVELFYPVGNSKDTLRLKLKAGERGILSHQNNSLSSNISTPSSLFWMDRTLIFKNKPLQEVFKTLEQCYDIRIDCDDNNINLTNLSSTFKDKEVNEVLDVIAATFDIAYQQQGKTYRIYRP
ncbi:FecR domain-containing protein [Carboxylicivirga sp. RSCT41]|uniref:FecR domain-containing protein n=1 Tax=Carboxylicivirga agarovorans TaxID=3417570 RepID=UPI003D32866E